MISATAVAFFAACKPDPVYPEECPREDAAALQAAFEADSLGVVRSGACDAHERVVDRLRALGWDRLSAIEEADKRMARVPFRPLSEGTGRKGNETSKR